MNAVRQTRHPGQHRSAGRWLAATGIALASLSLPGCHSDEGVSYAWDVYPILEQKCVPCHTPPEGPGYVESGLDLTTYEGLMRGSRYRSVVVPGNSRHSILNMSAEGRVHPLGRMKNKPLSDPQAEILRLWVEQGARDN